MRFEGGAGPYSRTRHQRYRLQGEVCGDCHKVIFPPRDICPYCGLHDTTTLVEYRPGVEKRIEIEQIPEVEVVRR